MRCVVACLIALNAGCFDDASDGAGADADAGSAWDVEHTFVLPAGQYLEAEVGMTAGNELVVSFDASPGAIRWDIHSYEGDLAVKHLEGDDSSIEITFEAPADGDFHAMWENIEVSTTTVSLRLKLTPGDQLLGWH